MGYIVPTSDTASLPLIYFLIYPNNIFQRIASRKGETGLSALWMQWTKNEVQTYVCTPYIRSNA